MTSDMMKEILEDWMSWKYDIIEMNNSEWTVRDDSKLAMIEAILKEQLNLIKAMERR
jgi:hypothetical protein